MTNGKDHEDRQGLYDLGIPELYKTAQEYDLYPAPEKQDEDQIASRLIFSFGVTMQKTSAPTCVVVHRQEPSPEWDEGRMRRWVAILKQLRNGSTDFRLTRDSVSSRPPLNITPLFALFLSSEICDAVVGDLQERYTQAFTQRGRTHATLWFLKQAATSLMPFAWAALKRVSGVEAIYRRIGR
jgi:hypothetical protein